MNILVTGANGQLGNEMRLVAKQSKDNWFFTDVVEQDGVQTIRLDITNSIAVRDIIAEKHIDVVVNCAAYTNVEGAEDNTTLAEQLNATAPKILAEAVKDVNGLLIQISTDYVFGKEPYNVPCREHQKGTPTGVYGVTKLHGEQNIFSSGCKHIIIRTAWLYSEFGKNFCKTMLSLLSTKQELKVVFDQTGTPTYALDLANAIAVVIDDYGKECWHNGCVSSEYSKSGVYHYSNEGVCSWYDFTKMIQILTGGNGAIVLPCHSDEFPSKVIRPAYSVLDKTKIKQTYGIHIPYWTDSLRKCIDNLLKQ